MKTLKWLLPVLLLLTWTGIAAAETPALWVSPTGEYTADAIQAEAGKNGYRLFLPGEGTGDWKIGLPAETEILLNGQLLHTGDSIRVLLPENTMQTGRKETRLTVMRGSPGLPAVYLTTETGSLDTVHKSKKNKEPGQILLRDGSGESIYTGPLTYLKMRGNATTIYPKKSYQIRLEKGASLFGMGKARKWVLRGSYIDRSFLREEIAFSLAEYAGMQFVPEHVQCELYINHEYAGLYLFMEKIEPDDDRVDIADLEKATKDCNEEKPESYKKRGAADPEPGAAKYYDIPRDPADITGGYILEYEATRDSRYREGESAFQTIRGINMVLKSPEYASKAQVEYIAGVIRRMENAVFAEDGRDPDSGKHFTELLDLDSFVKKYILNELLKNYDANASSEYMYKPEDGKSGKVFAGPVWDLDNCMATYARDDNMEKILRTNDLFVAKAGGKSLYWPALCRQPLFMERVRLLYGQVFQPAAEILLGKKTDPSGKLLSLEEYAARIAESAEMNYTKFPELRGSLFNTFTGKDLAENIGYIRDFLRERTAFLHGEWIPESVLED